MGLDPLKILVYSQVALSLLIPLPLIPLIYYSSKREIMGEFTNTKFTTMLAYLFAVIILIFNGYLLYQVFTSGI